MENVNFKQNSINKPDQMWCNEHFNIIAPLLFKFIWFKYDAIKSLNLLKEQMQWTIENYCITFNQVWTSLNMINLIKSDAITSLNLFQAQLVIASYLKQLQKQD